MYTSFRLYYLLNLLNSLFVVYATPDDQFYKLFRSVKEIHERPLQDSKIPLRYTVGFDDPQVKQDYAVKVSEASQTYGTDSLTDIHPTHVKSKGGLKLDLLGRLEEQVTHLNRGIEGIHEFRASTLTQELKLHQEEKFLELQRSLSDIIDQSRKDFQYLKNAHHIYMVELGKTRARVLHSIISKALENSRLRKMPHKIDQPVGVQIILEILRCQRPKPSFISTKSIKDFVIQRLRLWRRRVVKSNQNIRASDMTSTPSRMPPETPPTTRPTTPSRTPFTTPPASPLHFRSPKHYKDMRLGLEGHIDREATLNMIYIKGIDNGKLTKSDKDFLATVGTQLVPDPRTKQKDEFLETMYESFVVRLISPQAFESARRQWSIGIELAFIDRYEEELIYIVKNTPKEILLLKDACDKKLLSSNQTIIKNLREKIDLTYEIEEKLHAAKDLTSKEVGFLGRHFDHELGAIRSALDSIGYPYLTHNRSSLVAPDVFGHAPLAYREPVLGEGTYLKYALTDHERQLLRFPLRLELQGPQPHIILKELNDLKGFRDQILMCRPPPLVELIEFRARSEVAEIQNSDLMAQRQMSSLQQKAHLVYVHPTITTLGSRTQEYGIKLLQDEHEYLENMPWEEKGKEMLKIMNECHVYPPSPEERRLWLQMLQNAPLRDEQTIILQKLSELYDISILNTMSENEVILSGLSRLEDDNPLGQTESKEYLSINQLKIFLEPICNSPLKKYILFKSIEKYYPHTLEGMVLGHLNEKRDRLGYLSIWETSIYRRLSRPLWKRDVGSVDENKVVNEIYSKSLEDESTSETVKAVMRNFLDTGSTTDTPLYTCLTDTEIRHLENLRLIIVHESLPTYDLQINKLKVSNLFKLAERRERLRNHPEIPMLLLQFYKEQIVNLSTEIQTQVHKMNEASGVLEDQVLSLEEWQRSTLWSL